jgi:Sulfotransferase family
MIFGSHTDLAVAHEPRFLATMAPKHAEYESDGRLDVDRFLADLYSVGNFRRLGLPKSDVKAALATGGVTNFSDAVRVVFEFFARSKGKPLYGDKTPLYITFIEPIAEVLPETRFVHLVRDGRDVTLAYLERDKGPATVAEGAFHWRLRVTRGRKSGRRLGADRYREFHYEDLIDDPEGTVRQICEFLDLEFQPSMLDYEGTSETFLAEAKNPGDHQHLTMAPTKGLIDWRR